MPSDVYALLAAYCEGVNRALQGGVPRELRLFGIKHPDPWTLADSVVLARLVGFVGLAQSPGEMQRLLVQMVRAGVPGDPHLELRLPAIWSEVVGTLSGRWVIAATMPGLPAFLVGRTDALAWTPTYAFMDATDSWVEQCRDGLVRRDVDGETTWVPVATRVEEIAVRRGEPVRLVVHETYRGLLDGDPAVDGLRLATRWSGGRRTECGPGGTPATSTTGGPDD